MERATQVGVAGTEGYLFMAGKAIRMEREERRVPSSFDVLQAGWSDSTFAAEWVKQQQEEEAWAGDDLTVVEADDRLEGFAEGF